MDSSSLEGKAAETAMAHELRDAARIPCRLPVWAEWSQHKLDATAVDVSRTGVRIAVRTELLLEADSDTLVALARRIDEVLSDRIWLTFHPEMLGTLIQRHAQICRLDVNPRSMGEIHIGCRFDHELNEVDAAALGISVPLEGGEEAAVRGAPPRIRSPRTEDGGGDSHRLSARLDPTGAVPGEAFEGAIDSVSRTGIVVRIPDREALGLDVGDVNVGSVFTTFCETYGAAFDLELAKGEARLWAGPVQVHQVEALPSAPNALVLGFAFASDLSAEELRAIEQGR